MLPREIYIQEGKVLSLNSVKIYIDKIILILKITIIRIFTKSSYFLYFLSLLNSRHNTQYSLFVQMRQGPGILFLLCSPFIHLLFLPERLAIQAHYTLAGHSTLFQHSSLIMLKQHSQNVNQILSCGSWFQCWFPTFCLQPGMVTPL